MAAYRVLLPAAAASPAPDPPAPPSCAVTPAEAEEGAQRLHSAQGKSPRTALLRIPRQCKPRRSAELLELILSVSQLSANPGEEPVSPGHYSCQEKW